MSVHVYRKKNCSKLTPWLLFGMKLGQHLRKVSISLMTVAYYALGNALTRIVFASEPKTF